MRREILLFDSIYTVPSTSKVGYLILTWHRCYKAILLLLITIGTSVAVTGKTPEYRPEQEYKIFHTV